LAIIALDSSITRDALMVMKNVGKRVNECEAGLAWIKVYFVQLLYMLYSFNYLVV